MMRITLNRISMGTWFHATIFALALCLFAWKAMATDLTVMVVENETKNAVPVRCRVLDSQGVAVKPAEKGLFPIENVDHFYPEGPFTLDLSTGLSYRLEVDRGLGVLPANVVLSVTEPGKTAVVQISRYVDLPGKHWVSGDMDLRVPVPRMPVILGSADLNIACQTVPPAEVAVKEPGSERGVYHYPGARAYSARDWNFGDYNLLSAVSAMSVEETPFTASQLPVLSKGRGFAGMIDVTNPDGDEVPVVTALGWVDMMRIVGPKTSQDEVWTEKQVMDRFESYYRYLDCGFQIPVSAASLATEKTFTPMDRAGAARLFARVHSSFSFGAFVKSMKAGKSWASNGPLLSLAVNGRDPGEVIRSFPGAKLKISLGARSKRPLSRVELVYNGEVVSSIPVSTTGDFALKDFEILTNDGGWIVARAFEAQVDSASPVRYAHTSPFYVISSGETRINKAQAQKFLTQIEQRLAQLHTEIPSPDATAAKVLGWYEQARQKYLKMME